MGYWTDEVTRENAPDLAIKRFNEREDRIGDFRCTRLLYEHFNIYIYIYDNNSNGFNSLH